MTEHGATVQLTIDPRGAETAYEVWVECQNPKPPDVACGAVAGGLQTIHATLPSGSGSQHATVEMTGLEADYAYAYRVAASNAAGRTVEMPQLWFETFAVGKCKGGCPYSASVSLGDIE